MTTYVQTLLSGHDKLKVLFDTYEPPRRQCHYQQQHFILKNLSYKQHTKTYDVI